jgi:putative phosphoribosyl transferase
VKKNERLRGVLDFKTSYRLPYVSLMTNLVAIQFMTAKLIDDPTYRERTSVFQDRQQAGKLLAKLLRQYAHKRNAILLTLPAGGVPVGYAVANELRIPMEVIVVRKIQIPWNTEAGFGASTWDGETILNKTLVAQLGLSKEDVEKSIQKTRKNIQERLTKFRGNKPMPELKDSIAIIVDDGLASGFTMLAAARTVRKSIPEKIVAAVPTASIGAIRLLSLEVDEIVCLNIRTGPVFAVADAYKNWYDVTDEEALQMLERARKIGLMSTS